MAAAKGIIVHHPEVQHRNLIDSLKLPALERCNHQLHINKNDAVVISSDSRVIPGTPNNGTPYGKFPVLFPYLQGFLWEWYGNSMGNLP